MGLWIQSPVETLYTNSKSNISQQPLARSEVIILWKPLRGDSKSDSWEDGDGDENEYS